ncbi:MAG: hypothetical protein KF850_16330 [Labilithrix sp.]|nr:hypothetical protein [Labilithrix sp.]
MRVGAFLVGLFGLAVALTADAAPIKPTAMAQPKKVVANARPKCEWTGTLPALPAACAGKAPTLAQCLDPTFLAGACGKTDAIQKSYCTKLLFDDYCKVGGGKEEELVFPAANPKFAPPHAISPATPTALHIPPGTAMGGRQVPYLGLTKTRPAPASKPPAPPPNGASALSTGVGGTNIVLSGSGSGTFGTISVGQWLPRMNRSRGSLYGVHEGLVLSGGSSTPQVEKATNDLFSQMTVEGMWVGNGQPTAANMAVNSCAEYSYQRWYDYLRFKYAAKQLSRDYRGVFALATDPGSPVNLEKATLTQFGGATMPSAWPRPQSATYDHTRVLPHNPFFLPPTIITNASNEAKATAVLARIAKYGDGPPNNKKYMSAPGGTRFNLHKVLKQQIESRYRLSDDQYAERQARQNRYLETILSRDTIQEELVCARTPHVCCSAPPTNTPNQLHELLMKIQGWAVINPDPTKFAGWGVDVGTPQVYDSWIGVEQGLIAGAVRTLKGSPVGLTGKVRAPVAQGAQFKQKVAGGQASQYSQTAPPTMKGIGGKSTYTSAQVSTGLGGQTCEQNWAAKKASLEAAMDAVAKQLTDLVLKEYDLGAEGCLAEPVGGDLGNSCDWSYEKFSHFVMSYFDEEVQTDFDKCNTATQGTFATLKDPAKQTFIYPCELRHDFSADQHDIGLYINATPQKGQRFACEGKRAARDVESYLQANAEKVRQIPIKSQGVVGESSGDRWSIGDPSTFGAFLDFGLGWELKSGGAEMSDGAWCKPVGSSTLKASAGFNFFGSRLEVIDGNATAETTGDGVWYTAIGRYRDFEHPTSWVPLFETRDRVRGTTPVLQLPAPIAFLGGARADFWTMVGPVPLHIFFGGAAMAGAIMKDVGTVNGPAACADRTKASEGVVYGFQSGAQFVPFTRADAFGDASLDVGVAAAGLHIDLLLVRLGLPTGSMVTIPTGGQAAMLSGSNLTVDALSGRISAYVRAGLPPLAVTYETTLFAWDGIHESVKLWGSDATVPVKLLSWASDKTVDTDQIKCIAGQNPTINIQRPYCLKHVVDASKTCSPYPEETYCNAAIRPYKLRGTP